jgi:hypothetical protein
MKDWPATGDSIFNSGSDWQKDALLTIFTGLPSFLHYATSFKEAGDVVVASVERGQQSADSVGLAICFLYRHYIEVMLKGLICLGSNQPDYPKHHRIRDL